jgi:Flp pilus assembly protein TadG
MSRLHRVATRLRSRSQRGAVGVEMVIVVPVVMLLLELGVAGGRHAQAQSLADSAAYGAARAASLAADPAQAMTAATDAAAASLAQAGSACTSWTVNPQLGGFQPGGSVTVDVTCQVSFSDLTLLPLPGSVGVTGHAVSPIDEYRST